MKLHVGPCLAGPHLCLFCSCLTVGCMSSGDGGLASLALLAAVVMLGSVPQALGLVLRECSALAIAPDLLGSCRCSHLLPPGWLTALRCVCKGMFSFSFARCSRADRDLGIKCSDELEATSPAKFLTVTKGLLILPALPATSAAQSEGCVLELSAHGFVRAA